MKFPTKAIFFVIFLALMMILAYRTNLSSVYGHVDERTHAFTQQAVESAMEKSLEIAGSEGYRYGEAYVREHISDVFFTSMSNSFNYLDTEAQQEELKLKVPILCFLDTNGMYIAYNEKYHNDGLYTDYILTPLRPWSIDAPEYTMHFELESNVVTVYDKLTKKTYTGNVNQVYEQVKDKAYFAFLNQPEAYSEKIKLAYLQCIESNVKEVLNNQNYVVNPIEDKGNGDLYHYDFHLPTNDDQKNAALVCKPGIISFYQDTPLKDGADNKKLNVYSFAGYEEDNNSMYYIVDEDSNGIKHYHKPTCSTLAGHNGVKTHSKMAAAEFGAFPCDICNP